jgi:N-acetylneuraminic acid mutarotase
MPTKRGFFASAVVNNVIYVIGGGNGYAGVVIGGRYPDLLSMVEAYDPETNTWTQRTSMPTSRKDHTCTVVNNIIYVIGGRDTSNVEISTVEAYDPLSDSWTNKAPMQLPRSGLSCAVVNNIIYAIGGAQGCVVEAYNPLTNIWTSKANMPSYRDYLTCAVVNNIIYTIGGKYYDGYGGSGVCSIVEAYDPLSNTWTKKSYMPTSRYYLASAVVNNKIFVIGGQSEYNNSLALLEIYDPSTDIWTTNVPSMPTARFGLVCSTTNNKIYAIGGCTMSNVYPGPQIVYDYYNCVEVFHP